MTDLSDAIIKKLERGDELTEQEQSMLDAAQQIRYAIEEVAERSHCQDMDMVDNAIAAADETLRRLGL